MSAKGSLLALALVVALALVGCGGGKEETTETGESTVAAEPLTTSADPKPEAQEESAKDSQPTAQSVPQASERTPGTRAPAPGVPVTPEGDNSIQTFGAEGEADQSEQATATLASYLEAMIAGDWQGACAAASEEFEEDLAKLIADAKPKPGAKEQEKPKGCAETLALLIGASPEDQLRAALPAKVLSFRIRDDGYAYLIYEDPDGKVQFIAMANDEGAWKVNTVQPAPFQAASQGEAQ